jgi:hypothetical protein
MSLQAPLLLGLEERDVLYVPLASPSIKMDEYYFVSALLSISSIRHRFSVCVGEGLRPGQSVKS